MSQDEFTKLFNHMNKRFDAIEARFDQITQQFSDVHAHFDELHGKADVDDTERLVITKQLNQHEDWITQAGNKIGLQYDHAG